MIVCRITILVIVVDIAVKAALRVKVGWNTSLALAFILKLVMFTLVPHSIYFVKILSFVDMLYTTLAKALRVI